MRTARSVGICVALLAGCGGGSPGTGPVRETDGARLLQTLRERFVVDQVDATGASPRLTALPPGGSPLEVPRSNGRFLPRFRAPMKAPGFEAVAAAAVVELSENARGGFLVRDERSGVGATVELEGAGDVPGMISDGYAVYPRAHVSGADILHRPHLEGTEDYVHFPTRPEREELRYRVALQGVRGLRVVERTIELLDAQGVPRLRASAPWAVDASGRQLNPSFTVEGCAYDADPRPPWGRPVVAPGAGQCTFVVRWRAGASYPLLLDPAWTTTGSLSGPRASHRAALLESGKVLVFGGVTSTTYLATAEVYDPASGTWAVTGSMSKPRGGLVGLKLSDGRVMAAGGQEAMYQANHATVEAWSEATGTWTALASMPAARTTFAGVQLGNGKVLVCGGSNSSVQSSSVIYDPSTDSWTAGPAMSKARTGGHTATLLTAGVHAGKVLVIGGATDAIPELFDPATSTWSLAPTMAAARSYHSAVLDATGILRVAGGLVGSDPSSGAESFKLDGTWTSDGNMKLIRSRFSGTLLDDGGILYVGGEFYGLAAEVFRSGTFVEASGTLPPKGIERQTATKLQDGRVLIAAGDVGTPHAAAYVFSPVSQGQTCAVSGECKAGLSCASGVCCDKPCTAANESCVQSETGLPDGQCGKVMNGVPCSLDNECGSGFCKEKVCCDQACATAHCIESLTGLPDGTCARYKNGYPCGTNGASCQSGFCVDGVCCNNQCNTLCKSCISGHTGVPSGTCAPVIDGNDPADECDPAGASQCALPGVCDGNGACKSSSGTACSQPSCDGSTLHLSSVCNTLGQCDLPTPASISCAPYQCRSGACLSACVDNNDCVQPTQCIGNKCGTGKGFGATCSSNEECSSTYCVDGICCNSACDGPCVSCKAIHTAETDGLCSDVDANTDPRDSCPESADPCAPPGLCDGNGACKPKPSSGSPCGPTTCAGLAVQSMVCDAQQGCVPIVGTACPGGYACSQGTCLNSCGGDADCAPGNYCKAGSCQAQGKPGEKCSGADQCETGLCADGVCCDSPCEGPCVSCLGKNTNGGIDGKCDHVQVSLDPRNGCTADSGNACGAPGVCDGQGECVRFAGKDAPCGSDSCSVESVVVQVCDGFGACKTKTKQSCTPYACDDGAGACKSKCLSNADCAAGAECNSAKQECAISGATCADAFTVQSSTGQKTSCEPYSCLNGACKTSCSGSAECSSGHACNGNKCVASQGGAGQGGSGQDGGAAAHADSGDSGGCSTVAARDATPSTLLSALFGLAALTLVSRRRAR